MLNHHGFFRFYYGWIIVGLAFCSISLWFGIRTSFSVFYVTFLSAFTWAEGPLAGVQAIALMAAMVSSPLIGTLIDRYGARRILLPCVLIASVGLALCSTLSTLFEFYLYYGIVTGSTITAAGVVGYSVILRKWFREKLGLASGFAVSGMGMGMLVFVPLVQYSIAIWGWRKAFLLLATFGAMGLFPATLFLLREKAPKAHSVKGVDKKNSEHGNDANKIKAPLDALSEDQSFHKTVTGKVFWHFVLFSFFSSIGVYIILVHSVKFLVDSDMEGMTAAFLFALVGAISSIFRIVWGWLSDRLGREKTYTFGCASVCIGIGGLLLYDWFGLTVFTYWFTLFFGIGWGVTAPSVMAASADIFGGRQYGLIIGIVQAAINLAGAIGAWFGGMIYGHYQSYTIAFLLSITFLVMSCLFMWMAAPRKMYKALWQINKLERSLSGKR
jgi:MFS family permease